MDRIASPFSLSCPKAHAAQVGLNQFPLTCPGPGARGFWFVHACILSQTLQCIQITQQTYICVTKSRFQMHIDSELSQAWLVFFVCLFLLPYKQIDLNIPPLFHRVKPFPCLLFHFGLRSFYLKQQQHALCFKSCVWGSMQLIKGNRTSSINIYIKH